MFKLLIMVNIMQIVAILYYLGKIIKNRKFVYVQYR